MYRNEILENLEEQIEDLREYLKGINEITIGTLGPQQTTSYYSLQYFLHLIKEFEAINVKVILREDFRLVHKDLLEGKIDMAIIPNAYEHITEMYWDIRLKNVCSYLLPTPYYGLAVKDNNINESCDRKIKISTCSPVKCLLKDFVEEQNGKIKDYEVITAKSTTDAANMVVNGKADYAITNEISSIEKKLKFVSSKFRAEVIWTIFANRKKFEIKNNKEEKVM